MGKDIKKRMDFNAFIAFLIMALIITFGGLIYRSTHDVGSGTSINNASQTYTVPKVGEGAKVTK